MKDEFFAEVDRRLAQAPGPIEETMTEGEANLAFAKRAFETMAAVAAGYREGLQARGIGAKLAAGQRGFSFTMRYMNGGYRTLSASVEGAKNRIFYKELFTNGDGHNHVSAVGSSYSAENWSEADFESMLQACIKEYLAHASRQGGTAA